MKKNIFIFTLLLFSQFIGKAQEFDVGVKGGLSYVTLRGTTSEVSSLKGKLGAYVGA